MASNWWGRTGDENAQDGLFEWLRTVPGTPAAQNGYDRLERLYKINKEPQNYNYDELKRALDRGTGMSWRDDAAGQDYVNDWLARRQLLLSQKASTSSASKPETQQPPSSTSAPVPGAPSPAPGTSGKGSGKGSGGAAELIDGLTPAEFDLKAKLDILRETGNIDTQIKNMELEAAENLTKLSNANKLALADRAGNQSLMSTLVGAFNF